MLGNEYKNVGGKCISTQNMVTTKKKRKIRKKIIIIQ